MEPESSLPQSQVPATSSYPEPDQSSPSPSSHFLKIDLNVILTSTPGSSKCSVSLKSTHQNPVSTCPLPVHATCPIHLIPLDFIARIILGEDYRSLNSSLFSFLHSPVTSSLLGPNILLRPYSQTPSAYVIPQCKRSSFTPIQNNRQSYSSAYLDLYIYT